MFVVILLFGSHQDCLVHGLRRWKQNHSENITLGGIIGTLAVLVGVLSWVLRKPTPLRSSLLAGRGHDATEFQEAQAAMGFSYSGHSLDWMFLGLFLATAMLWFWRTRASLSCRLGCRLVIGTLVALIVLVVLQSVNNMVCDRFFQH